MTDLDVSLRRVSTGDHEALQQLVVAHLPDLERFIQTRTGQRFLGKESLADLVQSAAREALAHLSQHDYQGPAAFKAWLYKVALTKIVAKYRYHTAARRDVRREEQEASQGGLAAVCASFSTPSGAAMDKESEERFTAAFDRLSPEHNVLDRDMPKDYPVEGKAEAFEDGFGGPAPVGHYRGSNAFGLYDVHGNVFEWCRDWYGSYAAPWHAGDGLRLVGPASGHRVLRGGSYRNRASLARSAYRPHIAPAVRLADLGLRPARAIRPLD